MYCLYFQKNHKENWGNFRNSKILYTVCLACIVALRFRNAKRDSLYVIRIATRQGLVGVRLLFLIVGEGWPLEPSIVSLTRSDITNAYAPASVIVKVCTCSYQWSRLSVTPLLRVLVFDWKAVSDSRRTKYWNLLQAYTCLHNPVWRPAENLPADCRVRTGAVHCCARSPPGSWITLVPVLFRDTFTHPGF